MHATHVICCEELGADFGVRASIDMSVRRALFESRKRQLALYEGSNNEDLGLLTSVGIMAKDFDDWDTAIQTLSRVVKLGVRTRKVFKAYSWALMRKAKSQDREILRMEAYVKAYEILNSCVNVNPFKAASDYELLLDCVNCFFQCANYINALKIISTIAESAPHKLNHPNVILLASQCLFRCGEKKAAYTYCKILLDNLPDGLSVSYIF